MARTLFLRRFPSWLCSIALLSGCAVEPRPVSNHLPLPPGTMADDKTACDGWNALDVEDGSATIEDLAERVGMIQWDSGIGGTVSGQPWCTGTLVTPNLLLTAGHCFDSADAIAKGWRLPAGTSTAQDMCDDMHVQFNFQEVGGVIPDDEDMPTFDCVEVVDQRNDGNADFALLRLTGGEPGEEFGYQEIDFRAPIVNESITIIQHPRGEKKQFQSCTVTSVNAGTFSYRCDTDNGSSGSAVLDAEGRVIGVHVWGGCGNGGAGSNTAYRIDRILSFSDGLAERDYIDQHDAWAVESGDAFGWSVALGDFDCDGNADLAAGAPWEEVGGGPANGGFVAIRYAYGDGSGLDPDTDEGLQQNGTSTPEADDAFGRQLAVGDFDGDGCDDLAVGTSFEDLGATSVAGTVHIAYGSPAGIDTSLQGLQASYLGGGTTAYAEFGASLAAGDFDEDGRDDLAIGAPGEASDAGRVYVVYGSNSGLNTADRWRIDQGVLGVGAVEANDEFGRAVATGDFNGDDCDDLLVGAPGETAVAARPGEGHVSVVYGGAAGLSAATATGFFQPASLSPASYDSFGSALAAGDFNGDGRDDAAFGIASKDPGGVSAAGMVAVRLGAAGGLTGSWSSFTQSPLGVVEELDSLGYALVAGDLDGDGYDDLAVGSPFEQPASGGVYAGWALVRRGSSSGLVSPEDHGSMRVAWHDEGDWFGIAMAAGDIDGDGDDDLAIGSPGEDSLGADGAGAVVIDHAE